MSIASRPSGSCTYRHVQSLRNRLTPIVTVTMLLLSISALPVPAIAFPVQVATAPENTLSLILSTVGSARQSILVNIYELASPEVAQALIDQINRGVHVEILQEGEPVGGIAAASRGLHAQIAHAMEAHPGNRYVEMRRGTGGARRFRFDHAKYIVIDQNTLLLGSENYSPGGHPEPGTLGNRGWEVLVHDAQPARWFAQMFARDSDPKNPDIQNLLSNAAGARPHQNPTSAGDGRVFSSANPVFDASEGQIITSPDNSLKGIVSLIQSARSTLEIQQMSFNLNWIINGAAMGNQPPKGLSPIAQAIIAAARRGVRVRILLNDEFAFVNGGQGNAIEEQNLVIMAQSGKTTVNRKTVESLMQLAAAERLPLEARIANLQAMGVAYIHNKGVIVDRRTTLISSINWTQNSIQNNREAGLALTSQQIAAYFGRAFDQDWARSSQSTYSVQTLVGGTLDSSIVMTSCPSGLAISAKIGTI